MLKGSEFGTVRDVIARAFGPDEFDMFLFERLEFDRPVRVADGPFQVVVTNVLRTATQEGWEAALIAEVAAARPLRTDVQQVYENYAMSLVDEARREEVNDEKLKAFERFGIGPSVKLVKAGVAQLPSPTSVADSGLERRIRHDLPMLNLGLWRAQIFRLEGLVCRIEVAGEAVGTGFLVGPDTVLTNYHVLSDLIEKRVGVKQVKFRFDFQVLPNGMRSSGKVVTLDEKNWNVSWSKSTAGEAGNNPDATVPTEDELDYALVRLSTALGSQPFQPGSPKRGWVDVPTAPPAIAANMPMLIIQCPKGAPLMMTVDTSGVLGLNKNGTRVRYRTNTEEGSSGSPCFDIDLGLVALHHYGDVLHDKAQYNQGIPINAIRDRLVRQGKEAALGGHS